MHRRNDEKSTTKRRGSRRGHNYETDFADCPVKSFKKYISFLNPKIEYLFQRPKPSTPFCGPWFDAQVLGKNSLGNFMKQISIDANLSIVYTNHCIRATSVTVLDNCGIEEHHMSVSGHRSENSIRSYSRTGMGMKRKMSEQLANFCHTHEQENEFNDTIHHRNVHSTNRPIPSRESSKALGDYWCTNKRTFDFAVNLGINDESDDEDSNTKSLSKSTGVHGTPVATSSSITDTNHSSINNVQHQNKFRSKMSSIVGDSAHYVEFSNCTFNF